MFSGHTLLVLLLGVYLGGLVVLLVGMQSAPAELKDYKVLNYAFLLLWPAFIIPSIVGVLMVLRQMEDETK